MKFLKIFLIFISLNIFIIDQARSLPDDFKEYVNIQIDLSEEVTKDLIQEIKEIEESITPPDRSDYQD